MEQKEDEEKAIINWCQLETEKDFMDTQRRLNDEKVELENK